jgi:hypothetical protein
LKAFRNQGQPTNTTHLPPRSRNTAKGRTLGAFWLTAAQEAARIPKPRRKKKPPKRVLALPDLEQTKSAVINSLTSKSGQRTYEHVITEFVDLYCSEPRLAFNRTVVLRYRIYLEQRLLAPTTINLRLAVGSTGCLRSRGFGSTQPGACGGHPSRQRRSPNRLKAGQLAHRRSR